MRTPAVENGPSAREESRGYVPGPLPEGFHLKTDPAPSAVGTHVHLLELGGFGSEESRGSGTRGPGAVLGSPHRGGTGATSRGRLEGFHRHRCRGCRLKPPPPGVSSTNSSPDRSWTLNLLGIGVRREPRIRVARPGAPGSPP